MKVIIAGSRTITSADEVATAIRNSGFHITSVVTGCEPRGVDRLGEEWAYKNEKPIHHFPADWNNLGRAAGPLRNQVMAEFADALVAVWDGKSRGTQDMIRRANKRKLIVHVHVVQPKDRQHAEGRDDAPRR